MRSACGKFCSAISTVSLYWSLSSLILSMVRLTSTGASPTDGSSIKRMRGASINARASASICCSPPLSEPASWARRSARRGKHSKQKSRFDLSALRALRRNAPSRRFSSTARRGNRRRPSGTSAMPRSTICSVLRPMRSNRSPSISTTMAPARGRTIPMTHFISVDLPLPLVPSSTTVSPELTWSDTSSSTRTAPSAASIFSMVRLSAKVSPLHIGIANHRLGPAVRDFLARDQHDQPLREFHYRAHDVLDQDDGDAALVEPDEQGDDVVDLRLRQSGHGLVGDQELRLGGHGARELELAHLHLGQIARQLRRLVRKRDELQ